MPRKTPKRWTVLIYMVADDPKGGELLDQAAVREMDDITKAALSANRANLNVALQIDFRTLPGVWRRVIGESTFVRPEGDAADPATLYGFFDWAVTQCPAEHYLLVFWGHSRAQFGMFADPDPFDYTAQTLTLDELRDALTAAKRSIGKAIDVIAFKDCYMATLETAYELTGLADYLLASPGLVPVEGWPYDAMFAGLAGKEHGAIKEDEKGIEAGTLLLAALKKHYEDDKNLKTEVPYSLLSTQGAAAVVKQLGMLVGTDRQQQGIHMTQEKLIAALSEAASKSGDPALVDLGVLVPDKSGPKTQGAQATVADAPQKDKLGKAFKGVAGVLGNVKPGPAKDKKAAKPDKFVIDHTGEDFGGASVFVYPSSPKAQRESRLTRLVDEQAYRRLAISTDTNWADVALRSLPLQPVRPKQPDVAAAIALLEQLERVGIGMAGRSAPGPNATLRRRAFRSPMTEAGVVQAEDYATIAEVAARLAAFAAEKGGGSFADKGGGSFADEKGGGSFADEKGGGSFADKGGGSFGPR